MYDAPFPKRSLRAVFYFLHLFIPLITNPPQLFSEVRDDRAPLCKGEVETLRSSGSCEGDLLSAQD